MKVILIRKNFAKTNRWNLNDAKLYIKDCEIKNRIIYSKFLINLKPVVVESMMMVIIIYQNMYLNTLEGVKIGYNIAIPSVIKPNGKRYTKIC